MDTLSLKIAECQRLRIDEVLNLDEWSIKVKFVVGNGKCDICGSQKDLEAHHMYNKRDYPEYALQVCNGVPLCDSCHTEFHQKYGDKNNTPEQYEEFKHGKKTAYGMLRIPT